MTDCSCSSCVGACRSNPGWPTPAEAARFIADGHAKKLMCDWLEASEVIGNDDRIYLLAPAAHGHEGEFAPEMSFFDFFFTKGRCVFLTEENRCSVHDHKPMQCRMAMPCQGDCNQFGNGYSNWEVAKLWDTDEGRGLVTGWKRAVGLVEDAG